MRLRELFAVVLLLAEYHLLIRNMNFCVSFIPRMQRYVVQCKFILLPAMSLLCTAFPAVSQSFQFHLFFYIEIKKNIGGTLKLLNLI
jgi:hypothetical protein